MGVCAVREMQTGKAGGSHAFRPFIRTAWAGKALALGVAAIGLLPSGAALANGSYENRSWQFDTSADKANKAGVVDMIERKKGGYYDGFKAIITNHNTTNIGTQVNCNNSADARGNAADNSQTANSPTVGNSAGTSSAATGNAASNGSDGKAGVDSGQTNSGTISSGISNTSTSTSSGAITTGSSNPVLNNSQQNSGAQTASIAGSTACDLNGATVTGQTKAKSSGPLN